MTSITITIPHPPSILRPNGRGHWRDKNRAAQALKGLAKVRSIGALALRPPPLWKKAKVTITWRSTTLGHPDPDNIIASLKSAFDGIAAAGIIENDKGLWPERPIIETRAHWPEVVLCVEGEQS